MRNPGRKITSKLEQVTLIGIEDSRRAEWLAEHLITCVIGSREVTNRLRVAR